MSRKQFFIDQAEAGYMLGVDARSIQTWSKRPVDPLPVANQTPRGQPNEYDPPVLVQWYVRNELNKLDLADGELLDLNNERAKLARLQAAKVELDLAERNGQLVDVEAAGHALDKVLMAVRSKLLALPTRLAPVVVGSLAARSEALEGGIHDALHELADMNVREVLE